MKKFYFLIILITLSMSGWSQLLTEPFAYTPVPSLLVLDRSSDGQPERIVPHDLFDLAVAEAFELEREIRRIGQALGVGPIRAEQHIARADQVLEADQAVLVEGRDPDVFPERLAGILEEALRTLAIGPLEGLEEPRHPEGAHLDTRHADVRETLEEAMSDQRRDQVERRLVGHRDAAQCPCDPLRHAALGLAVPTARNVVVTARTPIGLRAAAAPRAPAAAGRTRSQASGL